MQNTYVLIMAGGSGTRFWPYSRENKPKQFLDIMGIGKSLLQLTVDRFKKICNEDQIFLATNEKYRAVVKEQCPWLSDDQILFEPARRNTGPCIAYAAYKIGKKDPDVNLIIAASDHIIIQEEKFYESIDRALKIASQGEKLVTLGIEPTRPATGYGYIEYGEKQEDVFKVLKFIEKPNLETAEMFLRSGNHVWNSGMFIWSIKTIKMAFKKHMPVEASIFESLLDYYYTDQEQNELAKVYSNCENISIDYGVMEKAEDVYVVKGDFTWSDIGSWNSVYELSDKDMDGNVVDANVLMSGNKNCIIKGSKNKLIAVEGLENYLIADYENAILICHRENESQVKEFVDQIEKEKAEKFL